MTIMPTHPNYSFVHEIQLPEPQAEESHVNNVRFFQFIDDARMAYLATTGCPGWDKKTGFGHIVVSNHCDYLTILQPLNRLQVSVKTQEMSKHSITMNFSLYSTVQKTVVAKAYSTVLTFDFITQQKIPVPTDIRNKISQLEARNF